ncbi:FAD-dependent oxidoreductase [Nocardia cyriacigeorgica]|uniref:FAD-dependent oxidoreductase n=1 Tax=Nocardia cyriacigeorgica TaxID=135487 RepID=UPI002454A641|nr:FAD-dependent oxidoreductase [Nocardia cyriacigeorgica]
MTGTTHDGRRAIIVGAGIGGLATAIALARRGWQVQILERADEIGEAGSGLTVWANGLRALDVLGVGAQVRARAMADTDAGIRDPAGRWLARTDTDELARRFGEVVMIPRTDLFEILREALPPDSVRLGCAVTEVGHLDGGVEVVHTGGVATGDLVVGADGIHSAVRQVVFSGAPTPRYAGYTAWRMITAHPVPALHDGGQTWGRGERFGVIALPDDRVYLFGVADSAPGLRGPQGEYAEVRRRFGAWHDPIPALLDAVDPATVLRHDIYELPPLSSYVLGRVALLGDAAHAMTPNMGQGANQGLEDAVTLAALLDRIDSVPAALAEYDRVRRPRTQDIARRSHRIGVLAQLSSAPAVLLRDTVLRLTPGRAMLGSFAPALTWQPPA